MAGETHPLAPHSLPPYIGGADGSDGLFTVVVWLLIIVCLIIGNLYLKLHAMPERIAHKQNSTQLQFIAVLAILALFTHNNIFWVLALLLSVVQIPDFFTPVSSIADSLRIMVDRQSEVEKVTEEPGSGSEVSSDDSSGEED